MNNTTMSKTFTQSSIVAINWWLSAGRTRWHHNPQVMRYLGVYGRSVGVFRRTLLQLMLSSAAPFLQLPPPAMLREACRTANINPLFLPAEGYTYITASGAVVAHDHTTGVTATLL